MKVKLSIEYFTRWGESLSLISNDRKFPMTWEGNGIWSITFPHCTASILSDYTYVVMKDGCILRTEWKHHHSKLSGEIHDVWFDCPFPGCPFPREHSAAIFDRPGFRGAGTAVPVFSLRSADDFGIGDFNDLKILVDWACATGQCIIQLLPINDTTRNGGWEDSYPYSPVSSFALHPLYLRLQNLGIRETAAFKKEQKALNSLEQIDYPKVFRAKMAYIRKAFESRAEKDMATSAFKKFVKTNSFWLDEYCSFCAGRDSLETEYYSWMQYHLDKQLSEVVEYARKRNVFFKGDLPIGVSAQSAEAHFHPELFNLDSCAGAPPDYFSRDGQNWGFPTYNWEAMAKNDFAWWKARLRKMSEYFAAFRIDHILGFFRIWEIPIEFTSGIEGHFNPALPYTLDEILGKGLHVEGLFHEDSRHPGMYQPYITPASGNLPMWQQQVFGDMYNDFFFHRHDEFWRKNAMKKLPELLSSTGMLACGEDLGMVPDCVPTVMEHEKILSLKMKGMEQEGDWKYLSVCATSSHDMDTLRMQSHEDPEPEECS
ncbi:MAG: 4-alpha-glucanotransferase, partial [Alistipes sp.]|nr:4-alpha-glucanotransferase [Candidatus Minthomonas equi]